MTDTEIMQDRWNDAVKEVRKRGVKIRQNVYQCCRGCIGWQKLGFKSEEEADRTPYAYTYGGQGNRYTWNRAGDMVYLGVSRRWYHEPEKPYDEVFFNHGGPDGDELAGARAVAEVFAAHGFDVEWDGTTSTCVSVFPYGRKAG